MPNTLDTVTQSHSPPQGSDQRSPRSHGPPGQCMRGSVCRAGTRAGLGCPLGPQAWTLRDCVGQAWSSTVVLAPRSVTRHLLEHLWAMP